MHLVSTTVETNCLSHRYSAGLKIYHTFSVKCVRHFWCVLTKRYVYDVYFTGKLTFYRLLWLLSTTRAKTRQVEHASYMKGVVQCFWFVKACRYRGRQNYLIAGIVRRPLFKHLQIERRTNTHPPTRLNRSCKKYVEMKTGHSERTTIFPSMSTGVCGGSTD